MPNNTDFNEQDIMTDCLTSQKKISSDYNTFASEAAHVNLKQDVMNILKDEHEAESMIFDELSSRGWYKTKGASEKEIQNTRQTFKKIQNKAKV